MAREIQYSDKYFDDQYEYRHVVLPQNIAAHLPPGRLLSEPEWRGLGVQQSRGWIHYHIHKPEAHILLFRRQLTPESAALAHQTAQNQELHRQQQLLALRMQQQQQQQQAAAAQQQAAAAQQQAAAAQQQQYQMQLQQQAQLGQHVQKQIEYAENQYMNGRG